MNATELRLNNFVYHDNVMVKIAELNRDFESVEVETKQGNKISVKSEFVKPIKLTKPWLVDWEFKPDIDLPMLYIRNGLVVNVENNLEMSYGTAKLKRRVYVHQFQNLYFDLTDEELIK